MAPESAHGDPVVRLIRALADRQPHLMRPDLARISDLMDILGSPQRAYPSVHITGTNGKTSTARMVDALLAAFGLRTGRYTSPHLESVAERICLDGQPVSPTRLAAAYDELAPYLDLVDGRHSERVTFFELLTALAFTLFADAPVDVGVIEVGLGGSWDATNIVRAPVCVVTPIDLDHTDVLGDTLADIAGEKAGIVHEGATAVFAVQQPEAADVLLARIAQTKASVAWEGVDFGVEERRVALGGQLVTFHGLAGRYEDVFLPLHGAHQAHNAALALVAVEAFFGAGNEALSLDTVRAGFAAADSPGRLELVRTSPTVLLDGAHNPAGVRALVAALGEAFALRRLIGVVAILADKDVAGVLTELEPVLDVVVCTANGSPRSLPAGELAAIARGIFGAQRTVVAGRLDEAIDVAVGLADADEELGGAGVLVTGSLVTVGEARILLRR